MTSTAIALRRLAQQRLAARPLATAAEVVAWLGAVQAQDYPGAKWALGQRMRAATDDAIERAFSDGAILRTHVMRPTWHFVTPADIRWMLALTAPRVNAAMAYYFRQFELDDALFARTNAVIAAALQGGQHLTRAELGTALARAGINATGTRLAHIVSRAELDAVVCSGPRRGKQFTYALLDERVPPARPLSRDEALAELTRRYFMSHGPATVRDFTWWSGLTVASAKAGLDMAGSALSQETLGGQPHWFAPSELSAAAPSHAPYLLPTYDEFLVGYAAFDATRRGGEQRGQGARAPLTFDAPLVIGGQVAGNWRRSFQRGTVVFERAPFAPLTAAEDAAVTTAAERYGQFLGMPVALA